MPDHWLFATALSGITVAKLAGIIVLFAAVIRSSARPAAPGGFPLSLVAPFCLYLVVEMVSGLFRGGGATLEASPFTKTIAILCTCLAAYLMISSSLQLRRAALGVIIILGIISFYQTKQYFALSNMYYDFRGFGGVSGDPNYYAAMVVLWLPLVILLYNGTGFSGWILPNCCVVISLIGFATAGSRGGLMGLAVTIMFLLMAFRRIRYLLPLALLLLPLLFILPASPLRRLSNPTQGDKGAADSRVVFWNAAWHVFLENPTFGVGEANYAPSLWKHQVGTGYMGELVCHNTYLDALAKWGLVGGVTYCWLLVAMLWKLRRIERTATGDLATAARLFKSGLLGYIVCIFFISSSWLQGFWLFVGLTMALARMHALEMRERRVVNPSGIETISNRIYLPNQRIRANQQAWRATNGKQVKEYRSAAQG